MNLCGWTIQNSQPSKGFDRIYPISQKDQQLQFRQKHTSKVSVKCSPHNSQSFNKFIPSTPETSKQRVNIFYNRNDISPGVTQQQLHQSNHFKFVQQNKRMQMLGGSKSLSRKDSLIDEVQQNKFNTINKKQGVVYYQREQLESRQKDRLASDMSTVQQTNSSCESSYKKSYSELLKENEELKRVIREQYKPLRAMYQKLKQQQEQRQFLISKLEWKVKQLGRQIKIKKP